jgi:hypothetical protein
MISCVSTQSGTKKKQRNQKMKIKLLLNSITRPTAVVDVEEDLGVTPRHFRNMMQDELVSLIMQWAEKDGSLDVHDVLGYQEVED